MNRRSFLTAIPTAFITLAASKPLAGAATPIQVPESVLEPYSGITIETDIAHHVFGFDAEQVVELAEGDAGLSDLLAELGDLMEQQAVAASEIAKSINELTEALTALSDGMCAVPFIAGESYREVITSESFATLPVWNAAYAVPPGSYISPANASISGGSR